MNRITALLLAFMLVLTLTACGDDTPEADSTPSNTTTTTPPNNNTSDLSNDTNDLNQTQNNNMGENNSTEPNGDGYTPFNLQWVDGSRGLISFNLQARDHTIAGWDFKIYWNGEQVVMGADDYEEVMGTDNSYRFVNMDISHHMQQFNSGEYYFEVSAFMSELKGLVVKSPTYTLGSEGIVSDPTPDPITPDTSGDSFFPDLDDSLLPDDVVKIIVGTVSVVQSSSKHIELRYDSVTRVDFDKLLEHYSAASTQTDIDNANNNEMARAICMYNWGEIYLLYDGSGTSPFIRVEISVN